MKEKRILIALYLSACMILMAAVFAIQGSLLTPIINEFSLSGSSQGFPSTALFTGCLFALIVTVLIQQLRENRYLLASVNILVILAAVSCVLGMIAAFFYFLSQMRITVWTIGFGLLTILGTSIIVFLFKRHGFIRKITKRFLLRSALCFCMCSLLFLFILKDFIPVVIAWWGLGFGLGMMDTLLSACMADLYPGKDSTRMMCILHTVFGLGSVITPMLIFALLNAGVHYRMIYPYLFCCFLLLIAVSGFVREVFRITDDESRGKSSQAAMRLPSGVNLRLFGLVPAMFAHGIFLSGLNTWINRYSDMLPGLFAIPAQSFLFTGIMLSRLLIPFLPIRTEKYLMTGGVFGGAVLALGLASGNGLVLRLSLLASGLLAGALLPCILSVGCRRYNEDTLLATTILMLALYSGQGISAPIITLLESRFGLVSGIFLCAVCMVLTSLSTGIQGRTGNGKIMD